MQTDPANLIRAILEDYALETANIHEPDPTDWDEFTVVFTFHDKSASVSLTGFAYVGDDFVGYFMPQASKVTTEAQAYRAAMISDDGEKPVSFAVQFNRDSGRFKTLFEFDAPDRWRDTARRKEIRAELLPNLR